MTPNTELVQKNHPTVLRWVLLFVTLKWIFSDFHSRKRKRRGPEGGLTLIQPSSGPKT